jgi:hypothetical protein
MNKKIAQLYQLGDPRQLEVKKDKQGWHDYLQYGFSEADVPELIELVRNQSLSTSTDRMEVWVPLYAWRILGQLRAADAITPLISMIEFFVKEKDEWAITEMSEVMGNMGQPAIEPLLNYLMDHSNSEMARSVMSEGLGKIAAYHLAGRPEVLNAFHVYLSSPDLSAKDFNGLLICVFMYLEATELIEGIRHLYQQNAVNLSIPGDIEDVEINLGLREKRETAEKKYSQGSPQGEIHTRENAKIGRNDPCSCGSGKKYKKCCLH